MWRKPAQAAITVLQLVVRGNENFRNAAVLRRQWP
jgi:hypothetical protein